MKYLGIHNSYQAGAALIVDDIVVGAVSEERFNRIKDYHGFPKLSIEYLLKESKLELKDIDKVVYGMVTSISPDSDTLEKLLNRIASGIIENPNLKEKYLQRMKTEMEWNSRHLEELHDWLKLNNIQNKINFIDHHHSHASGAFHTSPYDDAMVFTCDGKGNYKSSSVSVGKQNKLTLCDYATTFDSIGYFYGNITKALGYRAERHEGKVTGLAAHGDPEKFKWFTDKILYFEEGRIKLNLGDFYLPWFVEEKHLPEFYSEIKKQKPEDVAAAAQYTVEKTITQWVEQSIIKYSDTQNSNVCLSGGVFANVRLNQKIRELKNVEKVFIQPAMGDSGIPLGSCFAQMEKDGRSHRNFLVSMSLGPSFKTKEVELFLKNEDYEYRSVNNIEKEVADLIDEGKIIGFFQGRMEYGPRALCNRSIIFHCRDQSINTWLNNRLNRTEFMPFAPVTTDKIAVECFEDWSPDDRAADFMTMTYDVTDDFKKKCPAAVHVDGTARPQIVRKKDNPLMYGVIDHYYKTRGDLALINTSFNNHEEPIVCNISDALKSLDKNNVDILLIDNFIVSPKS